jgi:hypothetical protein
MGDRRWDRRSAIGHRLIGDCVIGDRRSGDLAID